MALRYEAHQYLAAAHSIVMRCYGRSERRTAPVNIAKVYTCWAHLGISSQILRKSRRGQPPNPAEVCVWATPNPHRRPCPCRPSPSRIHQSMPALALLDPSTFAAPSRIHPHLIGSFDLWNSICAELWCARDERFQMSVMRTSACVDPQVCTSA